MEIDLTKRDNSCVGHPIIRLNRMLRTVKSRYVKVIFSTNAIPRDAIVLLLGRRGFRLVHEYVEGSRTILLFEVKGV